MRSFLCCSKSSRSSDNLPRLRTRTRKPNFFTRLFGPPKRRTPKRLIIGVPEHFQHHGHVGVDDLVISQPEPYSPLPSPAVPVPRHQRLPSSRRFSFSRTRRSPGPKTSANGISPPPPPEKTNAKRRGRSLSLLATSLKESRGTLSAKKPKRRLTTLSIGLPQNFCHVSHMGIGQDSEAPPPPRFEDSDLYDPDMQWRKEFDESMESVTSWSASLLSKESVSSTTSSSAVDISRPTKTIDSQPSAAVGMRPKKTFRDVKRKPVPPLYPPELPRPTQKSTPSSSFAAPSKPTKIESSATPQSTSFQSLKRTRKHVPPFDLAALPPLPSKAL